MRVLYLLLLITVACRPSNQIGELVGVMNDRPLEGTTWLLIQLNGKDISTVSSPKPMSVVFQKEENRATGYAGCNSFTGTYTKEGSTISAKLATTRMFCEGKMEDEIAFLEILNTPHHYSQEHGHLILKSKGNVVAKFLAEIKTEN